MLKQGYLYVTSGKKYLNEAVHSVKSLKKVVPTAHATLITTDSISTTDFDRVIHLKEVSATNWKTGLAFKVKGLQLTPYEQTFFVDSDTYFLDSCTELFDLLHYFDVLMTQAPGDTSTVTIDNQVLLGYYPYNSGVIVYKKTPTFEAFLQKWEQTWAEKRGLYGGDQGALIDALLYFNLRIYTLPNIYNFRSPFYATIMPKKVKLIHGRHKDFEKIGNILNAHPTYLRTWHPKTQKVFYQPLSFTDRLYKIYLTLPEPVKRCYRFCKGFFGGDS